jgi:hypothetical protein
LSHALILIGGIVGKSVPNGTGRLVGAVFLFYACARIATHAKTLEERGTNEALARVAWLASPVVLLLLLLQMVNPGHLEFSFSTGIAFSSWLKLTLTADVAVLALFLVTCMTVWCEDSVGLSTSLGRMASAFVALLSLVLLFAIWTSPLAFVHHAQLIASLLVLSIAGTILVAVIRRIERLDEWEPPLGPSASAPTAPPAPSVASMTPQP